MEIHIDNTIIYQIIAFLVLLIGLNYVLFKPMLRHLDSRRKRIEGSLEEAKSLNEKTEKLMAEYRARLEKARLKALEEKDKVIKEAIKKEKEILEATSIDNHRLVEEARVKISEDVEQARQSLFEKAEILSHEIAKRLLGRSLS